MASKSKKLFCIIIPAYNEDKVIGRCIDEVVKALKKDKIPGPVIIVNDGSIDDTSKILKQKKGKYGNRLIILSHNKNRGYGMALQTGIKFAIKNGFLFYLTMDSDLTNNPRYIKDFFNAINSSVDCVKASRYVRGGKVLHVPYFRRIISRAGNTLASLIFSVGIKDCTNGFKMVRLSLLKNVHFKEKNFSIILEELYYLKKGEARFKEIPYVLTARSGSKSHFRYRPKIFYDYFKYVFKSLFLI